MAILRTVLILALVGCLAGCNTGSKSAKGFSLPDGDARGGETVFRQLHCFECHSVAGVDLPTAEETEQVMVRLGGEVTRIKTYGELVTSIINPSHRLASRYPADRVATEEGESRMKNYNDVMTVSQLIDVVAFLQSHYELREYEPTGYPPYF